MKKPKFKYRRPAAYGICMICSVNKGEDIWKEVDVGCYEEQRVVLCRLHFDDLFGVD